MTGSCIVSPEYRDGLIERMVTGATEVCNVDDISPLRLSEYPALPASVFPLAALLVTQGQSTVRAGELSCHRAEAGQAQGRAVVVGTEGHRLLSDNRSERHTLTQSPSLVQSSTLIGQAQGTQNPLPDISCPSLCL